MKRAALILIGSLIAVAPAHADCAHFKWSVAREVGWFKGTPTPLPAESGQADSGVAYALTLAKNVKLPYPPERAPGKDTYAAVIKAPKLEAGVYQITLSGEAWIDVAENDALVKSSDFSGQKDCPGVRKTVRFNLAAGPATIQISNAAAEALNFAISPSP
jgi:hypothetical protein